MICNSISIGTPLILSPFPESPTARKRVTETNHNIIVRTAACPTSLGLGIPEHNEDDSSEDCAGE